MRGDESGDFWNLDPFHPVLEDPLWPGHIKELKSVAGPSVTDQIGASVANSANEGGEPIPMFPKRDIIGGDPTEFTPDYSNTKGSKSAGDLEADNRAKIGKENKEKAAAKAKIEKEEKDKTDALEKKRNAAILADKLAKPATTMKEKEDKEKLIKDTEAKEKENDKEEKAKKAEIAEITGPEEK